ncbi:hypothetical protein [Bizionia arctica]|uniref:Calx-beta domain-containing protein n=1 Tax=Bizionia arctica TaxID=1495645 RepID=A0A917GEK4_9FLAO|nr:hypothetical protein [Bizionia arctica]GGG42033.1 hypothetical protein GCM10010976_11950 [Bizionia arctica]
MKKHIKTIALIAFTGILFTACSDDDDNTGASGINYTSQNVTLASPSPTEFWETAIDPADPSTNKVVIIASIPEITTADAVIDLNFSGSAVMDDDYEVSNSMIIIPAGSTSSSATITILSTGDIEGDETIIVTASANDGNFTLTPFTETFTILGAGDYINDVLNMEFDWEGEVTFEDDFSSGVYNFCGMDFDILVFDAAFVDTGNIDAQTGDCPEYLDFDATTPDGEYILVALLYENPYADLTLAAEVPMSVNYDQEFFTTSGTIEVAGFTTDSPDGTQIALATVTKDGFNYTVTPF